ncbi:UBA-like protein [Corchorus olitorius]|uniref:UBA-like protein n=1 Tax=Corchorus olitorius TaxID=93759 RepID=A0A1R3IJZ5_9ROSI|nr:UBA-like protein [Corchorus olitorius]
MVQSLKEIVNCPEPEIYAMLKECNMDPNEAVNRLLAQDPFHEVKSKRDKKKESKDPVDSRSRGANNLGNRGSRSGSDRYSGRGGSTHYSSNESGPSHGKPAQKRENGSHAYAGSSSAASAVSGNNLNRRPPSHSEATVTDHKLSTVGMGEGISSSSQPSGYQSAWLGVPGQVSMADIVKMGRPQSKVSTVPNPPHQSVNSRHRATKVSDVSYEPDVTTNQQVPPTDEWPPIEPSAGSVTSVLEAPADTGLYANAANLPLERTNQHNKSQLEEAQAVDNGPVETLNANHVGSPSISSRNVHEDDSGNSSLFDNNVYKDMNSYQPQMHAFEHDEAVDDSSSVAVNMQQLNIDNDDQESQSEEDNPSVIIPNHLQVHTPDCSHLSFGSFGAAGIGSAFSGPFSSMPLKNNLDEVPETADAASIGHSDNRNPEYYGDEHLINNTEGNIINSRSNVSTGNYEAPEDSRPEVLKQDASEAAQGNQYTFPSSATGYSYENSQQLNPAFNHPQTSSQMQNLTPFSSVMQAYTNSLPSTLLPSTVQTAREPDLPYSPFPVTQSMPTKYSNAASSISGPTISMPEALRAGSISAPQPTQQTLPGGNVATGPALPQHLAMHPFSQPTLPLGHFANMIGYPFLPQSYTYMPSAFQQTFAGNSTYPQSLAAVLPQYKNSVSVSSLPQSAAVASGYGFGSSTSIPGGLPLNPPTAPAGTTIGYDDVLGSQYKDSNHLMSLQQNENSGMWIHGPGSRTMSAVPASTYYSFQGQNQQAGGFRQGQQPSQHFGGGLGYPNFYHSQTGVSMDHQQQNPRDGSLSGSQGQPSKQTQQLWQNSY